MVGGRAVDIPGSDAIRQDALDGAAVKSFEDLSLLRRNRFEILFIFPENCRFVLMLASSSHYGMPHQVEQQNKLIG